LIKDESAIDNIMNWVSKDMIRFNLNPWNKTKQVYGLPDDVPLTRDDPYVANVRVHVGKIQRLLRRYHGQTLLGLIETAE
jgi:hypothetical protein